MSQVDGIFDDFKEFARVNGEQQWPQTRSLWNLRSLSNSYFLFLAKIYQLKLCVLGDGGGRGLRCYGYNRLVDWWIFSVKKLQINIKRRKIAKQSSPTICIVLVFHFKLKMAIIYNDVTEG